ncbi:DUF1697 domain-containing protein [Herbiconiux sp. P18]|uniref:DUF1697 domain-containing protein n=1 Tax=Herbiconiux liangxiaofengii TaxID=3342795 RepID=UPI0035BA3293
MTRWVALLRGVNVNGITVKSAELAELFRRLGFDGVKTVLASGNVLFEAADDVDEPALKARIEKGLGERFGYEAWIVLVDHETMRRVVQAYPFEEVEHAHPYVVFGSDDAVLAEITDAAADLDPDGVERARPGDAVVYWECPKGSSTDTPFSKLLARARFKASTTTRNLRTLRRLL